METTTKMQTFDVMRGLYKGHGMAQFGSFAFGRIKWLKALQWFNAEREYVFTSCVYHIIVEEWR